MCWMLTWCSRECRARGGLVIVQEIFGVNAHIRSVADRFANDDGFVVVAPAMFDRIEPGVDLRNGGADTQRVDGVAEEIRYRDRRG